MPLFRNFRKLLSAPLNRNRKLAALRRYAKWQLGSRLVPGKVLVDWVEGVTFVAGPGDRGLTGNVYNGLHEFADMAYVLHALDETDCFADVGANAGSYTLLACGVARAKGYCFEPVPVTYRKLLLNLAVNDLLSLTRPLNQGLGAERGLLRFTTAQDCTNHVLAEGEYDANAIEVPVVPLDESLDDAPSLMKIDVEGYETMVLRGATKTLENRLLNSILIELNGSGARYGFDEDAIELLLRKHDFAPYSYQPLSRELTPLPHRNAAGNTLFVRDIAAARQKVQSTPRRRILHEEV